MPNGGLDPHDGCSSDCKQCYPPSTPREDILDKRIVELCTEVGRLHAALDPVRDWYDEDGERTDVAAMLTDAVADLQAGRDECLKLRAEVERLKAIKEPPPPPPPYCDPDQNI